MTLLDQISGLAIPVLNPSGGCHNCPRRRHDLVPATLVDGPVLWLGEAPGATEVEQGEGFVGKSGQLMRTEAAAADVPLPWSFSNTIHCRPPNNATPKPNEIACCLSQYVLDEIRGYPIVVLAGNVPLQAIFPGAKGTHFRGNFAHHPDFPGQRFYTMWHPAYMLRRPDLLDLYRVHMERLARVTRELTQTDLTVNIAEPWTLVRGPAVVDALRAMIADPAMSLDFETTGQDTWVVPGDVIKSFAATTDGTRVVAASADDPYFVTCMMLLERFLTDPGKIVLGNFVGADIVWVEHDGEFRVRAAPHAVETIWYEAAQYKSPSLKQLVSEQLDGYRWLVHQPHTIKDMDLLLRYNAEDVVHSYHLWRNGMRRLRATTRDLVTRVLSPMSVIFRNATAHGLYIRQEYRQQKVQEYRDMRAAAVAAWKKADPDFVPDTHESGNGLADYLFTRKQLPVVATTETGAPSVDKAAIKQWIRGGAKYLENLLTIREIDKLLSTYLVAYDKHIGIDSRVHPTFWLASTDTSRPSSSDPNVFNIPRNRVIRDMFGVPPGMVMIESDLSQIEFRIMVCLARDETGIAGYLRGEDAHTMTARAITGNPNPTKEQRSQAKPINFGFLYGASARTAQTVALNDYGVEWSDAEADRFKDTFMATYRRIPALHEDRRRQLIANRGWFESITGHVFHYRDWDHPEQYRRDHAFRSALNAEAQGPAANICYYIAVLARRMLDDRDLADVVFVNSVYDSIITEVPRPKTVPAVIATLNDATQQAHKWVAPWFVVPLEIEHAVGESWGSLTKWQP